MIASREGPTSFDVETFHRVAILRLTSPDGTNRLTRQLISHLAKAIGQLSDDPNPKPLIIAGNHKFFSAGADLEEIAALNACDAFDFTRAGQVLMNAIAYFPAPTCAAIWGYCMGGGLDLALACGYRMAAPNAIFGHRGAALGLITGWGGTQRLPRLIGKGRALQMFLSAEKLHPQQALAIGLINSIAEDPVQSALDEILHS
ncbi:MAG: enoyl-CoA hydratase/isomerase family protein [Acidobacteriales bacterium]|nr:enoyl-CoA hydratase/isomerase family protein [Terriglobales bacterium]